MLFLTFILLIFFWIICNIILKKFLQEYQDLNEIVVSALKYRKTIMFDILALIFYIIFDFNFLIWIGIAYYIIITIIEAFLIVIAVISGLHSDLQNHSIDKELWLLLASKILNEMASIIMIETLFFILN